MYKRALAKKIKYKKFLKKVENEYSDSDGSVSDDEVDILETDYVGKLINNDYLIIKYISKGTFSRVWLILNINTNTFNVMKMYFNNNSDEYRTEVCILKELNCFDYNNFELEINNKKFKIIIMPYFGISLSDLVYELDRNLNIKEIKIITRKILHKLNEIHNLDILHTDLKLDNILTNYYNPNNEKFTNWIINQNFNEKYINMLETNKPDNLTEMNKNKRKMIKRKIRIKTNKEFEIYVKEAINQYNSNTDELLFDFNMLNFNNIELYLIDFSNSIKEVNVSEEEEYQIRGYRSPENIMGYKYNKKSEIWAIGCVIWKLLTNNYIFEPDFKLITDTIDRDRAQLAIMTKYLGKMNNEFILESPRTYNLFEDTGKIKRYRKIKREYLEKLLSSERDDLNENEIINITLFLKNVWNYNIKNRYSVNDCLTSDFLTIDY